MYGSQIYINTAMHNENSSLIHGFSKKVKTDSKWWSLTFQEIHANGTFAGVCGVWNVPFPWKHFKKRGWFQAAAQVLSLAVRYMEKVVPGYRKCEQNFEEDYIGMKKRMK